MKASEWVMNGCKSVMSLRGVSSRGLLSGLTLIELTVVIIVLIALISVLFIGMEAYKTASDRSSCIINIRNVQQAVRAHQNLNSKSPGDSGLVESEVYGTSGDVLTLEPKCPSGGVYDFVAGTKYPPIGELAIKCSKQVSLKHIPKNYESW